MIPQGVGAVAVCWTDSAARHLVYEVGAKAPTGLRCNAAPDSHGSPCAWHDPLGARDRRNGARPCGCFLGTGRDCADGLPRTPRRSDRDGATVVGAALSPRQGAQALGLSRPLARSEGAQTAAPAAAAASVSAGSMMRPPSASASKTPRTAQPTSTRIGPAIRAPSKNSADRASSTLAPGGNTPPIVLHSHGSSGRANGPPDAELPRMTNTRMTSAVPAGPAAAWMPAVAAPLAKMVSAAIPHSATTWPENTPKLARSMTTLRIPATMANAPSAPIRAPARRLLLLRALPTNPISVAPM